MLALFTPRSSSRVTVSGFLSDTLTVYPRASKEHDLHPHRGHVVPACAATALAQTKKGRFLTEAPFEV